jgi:hypothetical protein
MNIALSFAQFKMEDDPKLPQLASENEDCQICYETFLDQGDDDEETGTLRNPKERLGVEGCEHRFCRECLTNHCKHAISVREIPIGCPASASDQCENVLPESQIQDLLCGPDSMPQYGSIPRKSTDNQDSVDWIRFQHFRRMLQDPSLVSCSQCLELMSKEENQTHGGSENQLTCPFWRRTPR